MTERGLSFRWFLPTYGDSRGLMAGGHGSFMSGDRPATLRYLNSAHGDFLDKAERYARTGEFLHIVISRDTAAEAWAEADRLLAGISPGEIERVQANLAESDSEGQRRMARLHNGRTDGLEIAPNLWAGVSLVRGGAGTALVGSHAEVADRLLEYAAIGIDHFILSGYPHLEEAYWFGEGVLPILEREGVWTHPSRPVSVPTVAPFTAAASS